MRARFTTTLAGAAAAVLVLSSTSLAFADSLTVGPDVTKSPGTTGSFVVGLVVDDNASDPVNGCNARIADPVTVHFTSSAPAVVTAPADVTISGCDTVGTAAVESGVQVDYAVSSAATNGQTATITAVGSGGRLGGQGQPKVYGTFSSDSIRISVVTPRPSDSTAPEITPIVTGTLGLNGWYTSDVTVKWSVVDDESAISSAPCSDVTTTTDTGGVTYTCTATSSGGTATKSVTIKRDATPPRLSCAEPSPSWSSSDATIACTSSDVMAGLADSGDSSFSLTTSVPSDTETDDAVTDSRTITDQAGNSATAGPIGGNKVDKKAPSVTCGTADGVWHNADVSIDCTAEDAGSGLSDAGDSAFTLSTAVVEGTETGDASTGSRTVADAVGNVATAGPITGNMVDRKAPTVSWSAGAGQDFFFGDQVPAPTCTAVDGGSGLADGCSVSGFSTSVGTHTLVATAADNVGNVGEATLTYSVKAWTLDGFYQPVDMGGVVNTVKAGSTVPLKFNVFKGQERLTSGIGASFSARKLVCGGTAAQDTRDEFTTAGSTSLRYDSIGRQWIQNWATPRTGAGSCYEVTMTTADGSSTSAVFKLK